MIILSTYWFSTATVIRESACMLRHTSIAYVVKMWLNELNRAALGNQQPSVMVCRPLFRQRKHLTDGQQQCVFCSSGIQCMPREIHTTGFSVCVSSRHKIKICVMDCIQYDRSSIFILTAVPRVDSNVVVFKHLT